jgi:uncharacterized protein YwqG
METREDLRRKLADAGLSRFADEIDRLTRSCYRIRRSLEVEERMPVGASKFGGSPDVPAGFVWPEIQGRKAPEPMEFVGQIRLADLPRPSPEPVPEDGLLSFFTRWSEGRVFFFPEGTALRRTPGQNPPAPPAPTGFWRRLGAGLTRKPDARQTYRACSLQFKPEISPPDGNAAMIKALNLSEEERESYFDSYLQSPTDSQASDTTQHQMFGYSRPVQNEMELECDFLRRGETMRWDLPDQRFISAAQDWVLLLQADTDDYKEGPGWMWGDAGMVYFWIHRDDLIARAFDKVIAIEQCH